MVPSHVLVLNLLCLLRDTFVMRPGSYRRMLSTYSHGGAQEAVCAVPDTVALQVTRALRWGVSQASLTSNDHIHD